ncbi:MAG TPA: threonine--tRNA ligase, partial [Candidatus Dojkabacteria bacterium]|nr:threonine--tRNA ligase [Candidatus Dojkabacteria bacterium]
MPAQNKKEYPLDVIRHSASHVMAYAINQLYPEAQFGIGPSIENGFYYDVNFPQGLKLTEQDLVLIKNKMIQVIKDKIPFEKKEITANEAKKLFSNLNQPYKLEIIDELVSKGNGNVSIYKLGDFVDLCSGPHVSNSGEISCFELLSIAGAYWKGNEKNEMLTRIYGTAFHNENDLMQYINTLEESKLRDHRILGQQLDLFCFSDLVGPGLPLFTPRG